MEKTVATSVENHFLDTSVARPMLVGTRQYKAYFANEFGDTPCYINKYVRMEFKRSYLCNVIGFYFTLHLDTVPTIGEAMKLWSNRYQGSALKAILQLSGDLFDSHCFELTDPRDKQKALDALGRYIKRLEIKLRGKFKDTDDNTTYCFRAEVVFKVDVKNMAEGFRKFVVAFDDVQQHHSHCRRYDFLTSHDVEYPQTPDEVRITRHDVVSIYVKKADPLPNNEANRGFKNIAKNLDHILQRGKVVCTCKMCEKIGDAVIALETPPDMRLEHTDNSFNHLCPPIGLNHKQHPAESKVV